MDISVAGFLLSQSLTQIFWESAFKWVNNESADSK